MPKGSYVWCYFCRSEDLIISTCAVIMPDGKKYRVYYKDGSITTDLINHLTWIHRIFRLIEKKQVIYFIFISFN